MSHQIVKTFEYRQLWEYKRYCSGFNCLSCKYHEQYLPPVVYSNVARSNLCDLYIISEPQR